MNHQQRTQQKKATRRKEAIRRRRHQQRQHNTNVESWPQFISTRENTEHVPGPFMDAIEQATRAIRLSDPELPPYVRSQDWRLLKKLGMDEYIKECTSAESDQKVAAAKADLIVGLGEIVYGKLLERGTAIAEYTPMCEFGLYPYSDVFIHFDAMLRAKGKHGTIYYSAAKPMVTINGSNYVLGFTRHAAQRVTERLTIDPNTYQSSEIAFIYLSRYIHYEVVFMGPRDNRQPAVTMYSICNPGTFEESYAMGIGDVRPVEGGKLYHRIGYAPLQVDGTFAIATTFLTPGMNGTPECGLILEHARSYAERRELKESLNRSLTPHDTSINCDFRASRWFHEHGVKQLVELDRSPLELGPHGRGKAA